MALPATNDTHCPNCNAQLHGRFCTDCGQNQTHPDRSLALILSEFFDDLFSYQSRPFLTLFYLLFRPGVLTLEFFAGKRARYVHPFRLYLITSLSFFFVLSLQNSFWPETDSGVGVVVPAAESAATETALTDASSCTELKLDFLTEEANIALQKKLEVQFNKVKTRYQEDPGSLYNEFTELIPQIMFFLLPLFALSMKLLYIGRGIYYTEHLVLAVHNHCFLFLAMLVGLPLELLLTTSWATIVDPIDSALNLWMVVYIYLSMKIYYRQSHRKTLLKFLIGSTLYWTLFLIGLMVAFFWGVMTL